jgi:hypothetical protein
VTRDEKQVKRVTWFGELLASAGDVEGILVVLGVLLAIGLGWAIVELLAPVLLICAYVVIVAALRRVANDRHGCEANLGRSILWGALWATLYTLPLAAIVAVGGKIGGPWPP